MKVTGIGEIMLRLSTNKGKMVSQSDYFNVNYGGGEANVLISLSKFGVDTCFISKVSDDDIGNTIIDYLKSHSVDTCYVSKVDKRTGIYFLQVGSGNRGSKVIYDRANSAFTSMKIGDFQLEEALKDTDIFHFSGITLALSEDIRDLIMKILEHCKKHNIMVSYDSNYRSKLWSLEEASIETFKIMPYINILSAGNLDAENILKMSCDETDVYKKLQYYYDKITDRYPNIMHIYSSIRENKSASLNTLQCNYYKEKTLYSSKIQVIDDIVDRVGGGDALSAGVLYSILNNKSPEYLIEFATSASVLKHSIYGDANLINVEDVEQFMNNGISKISR